MKAAKVDKGSQTVGKSAPIGQVTMSQLREIVVVCGAALTADPCWADGGSCGRLAGASSWIRPLDVLSQPDRVDRGPAWSVGARCT